MTGWTPATRAALAGMLTMAAAMGVGRFVYTPILPLMIGGGALDGRQAGLVAGANFLGYLLGALWASAGYFAPRRRLWFFAGLSGSVATTAAMGLTVDWGFAAMVAVRFLSGVASAFAMIFVTSIAMARFAQEGRPGLVAVHFGGVGLGIAASAALVAALAARGVGWPDIWLASAVAALLALGAVALLLPHAAREERPAPVTRGGPGQLSPSLRIWIVSYGFFGFGYVITATFINTMARADPALAPVEPFVWMAVGLAGMPSIWAWNRLVPAAGVAATYALACLVEAAGIAVSVLVRHPAALLLAAMLLGGTFMAITALGLARARELGAANAARAIALMTAAFGLGQMAGPVLAGYLLDHTGDLVIASMLAAAALLLAAVLAIVAERPAPKGGAAAGA